MKELMETVVEYIQLELSTLDLKVYTLEYIYIRGIYLAKYYGGGEW